MIFLLHGGAFLLVSFFVWTEMNDERKTERKRKRFAARLKSSRGIICTDTPGPNIILCNVGRATGYEKNNILDIIKATNPDIEIPKFIAEKTETYSFLVFQRTEHAVSFFNTCNGKALGNNSGTPLYLNFVEKESVPNTEVMCLDQDPMGLTILNNFITAEEETIFMQLFDWTEVDTGMLKNRQVRHYGFAFRYGSNDVDLENPLSEKIPPDCDILWKRLEEHDLGFGRPDQLTVNKYSPGHGIPSHVDRHSPFGDTILSLSLGSSVVMDWKHHTGKSVPTVLPARSLLIMQGEARYDWQHGIQPTTTDPVIEQRIDEETRKPVKVITNDTQPRQTRISLTFRWTRKGPCECGFKALCDTDGTQTELDDSVASNLEELHVHQVYEQIAGHFSSTRHTAWPRVVQFSRDVAAGTVLLDLGAGNGKNVQARTDILQIAGERSMGLLTECAAHTRCIPAAACVRLDLLHAPLRDACADAVICIAVIHHMSTKARRLQAISTIHRLLRPSGKALITVWAKDQSRSNYLAKNKVASPNQQLSVNGVKLHVHENRTQFQHKDLLVPWKLNTKCKSKSVGKVSDEQSKNNGRLLKCDEIVSETNDHLSNSDSNLIKSDRSVTKSDTNPSKNDNVENTLLRFYHVFEEGELDELCNEVGFIIEETFYEEGNWCVICKKP